MEKTTETTGTKPGRVQFTRGARVGLSVLEQEVNQSVFVEIKKFGVHTTKKGDKIDKFDVINLESGEEQTMWVDGGLRGTLSPLGGPDKVVGKRLEIRRGPKSEFTDETGEILNVNTYDVWELSN